MDRKWVSTALIQGAFNIVLTKTIKNIVFTICIVYAHLDQIFLLTYQGGRASLANSETLGKIYSVLFPNVVHLTTAGIGLSGPLSPGKTQKSLFVSTYRK